MQHKVLKTFRWASNASSSFCCSMHLPEETIDGAVAAKSTTIKSQEELPDIVELLLLLPMVIFIKWTNFFMTLLFQFSASAMHQKAGSSKAARCCNLSVDFKHLGMTQYNSSSSRASSRRVLIFKFPQWFGTEDTHFSGEWEAAVRSKGRTPLQKSTYKRG